MLWHACWQSQNFLFCLLRKSLPGSLSGLCGALFPWDLPVPQSSTRCNVLSIIYEDLKCEGTSGLLKTLQRGKFLNQGFPSAGRDAACWVGDHPSFPLLSCLACPASWCKFLRHVKIRLRTTVQGLAIQFWEPTLIWTWVIPFRADPVNL